MRRPLRLLPLLLLLAACHKAQAPQWQQAYGIKTPDLAPIGVSLARAAGGTASVDGATLTITLTPSAADWLKYAALDPARQAAVLRGTYCPAPRPDLGAATLIYRLQGPAGAVLEVDC